MISLKILIWLFATIPAGLLLIWIGWRGRRINRVPACRQCWFNLTGVWPASTVCPECGVGLKQRGRVVTGQRRRVWWLIVPGGLGASMACLVIAGAVFLTLWGQGVYQYKPVSMLLWEGRNGSPEYSKAAANELAERMSARKLTNEESHAVVQAALVLQGNLERVWVEEWGTLIDQAALFGVLSDEQKLRYRKQAGVLELVVRPRVRKGDALPVGVRLKERRVGAHTDLSMAFQVTGIKVSSNTESPVDGSANLFAQSSHGRIPTDVSTTRLNGSATGNVWGRDADVLAYCLPQLRSIDEPGMLSISVECLSSTSDLSARMQGGLSRQLIPSDPSTRLDTLTALVEIVDADRESVELVPETASLKEQMLKCITVTRVRTLVDPDKGDEISLIDATIACAEPTVGVAVSVHIRINGTEMVLGDFTSSGFPGAGYQPSNSALPNARRLFSWVKGEVPDRVDLVLRPKPMLATDAPDLMRIYGGELVLEGIEVSKLLP
ncbi:MAG: hypothetical protein AABZ53_05670 [Planctomycetota bacterium]